MSVKLEGAGATRYEVRNYEGSIVDSGRAAKALILKISDLGWYKLYLFSGPDPTSDAGSAIFALLRKASDFPDLSKVDVSGGPQGEDWILRGVAGLGPERFVADCTKPEETIKKLDEKVALAKKYYLPYDSQRSRTLIISVPDKTFNPGELRKIVAHFKDTVPNWELQTTSTVVSGADYAASELPVFAKIIKDVSSSLKVLEPGKITLRWNDLRWVEDFLKNNGANSLDGFSFRNDDGVVGDMWLARTSLTQLKLLLTQYQASALVLWQTGSGTVADRPGLPGHFEPALHPTCPGAMDHAPNADV